MTTLQHDNATYTAARPPAEPSIAEQLEPIVRQIFRGPPPVPVEFWDGSQLGSGSAGRIIVRDAAALRRILWARANSASPEHSWRVTSTQPAIWQSSFAP